MTDAAPSRRLDLPPVCLAILIAPIAVYLLLEFILKTFGDGGFALPPEAMVATPGMAELTGRYRFMAAFAFFGAVSVSILVIFGLDLAVNYTRRTARNAVLALGASAAFGVVLSVLEPEAFGNFETYYLLGRDFFEASLNLGRTGPCADGAACPDRTAFGVFRTLTDPINALTSFGAAAALTGMILSLARPPGAAADDPRARAARLKAAAAVSQRYLYCAGLLLTAGITFLLAWMYWPSGLIADPGLRAAYNDMVGAISLYVGVGYSVMILSCYLPVMLVHAVRVDRVRAEAAGQVPHPDAPALDLPEANYLKALNAILAIVSPILASAIGTFGSGAIFA